MLVRRDKLRVQCRRVVRKPDSEVQAHDMMTQLNHGLEGAGAVWVGTLELGDEICFLMALDDMVSGGAQVRHLRQTMLPVTVVAPRQVQALREPFDPCLRETSSHIEFLLSSNTCIQREFLVMVQCRVFPSVFRSPGGRTHLFLSRAFMQVEFHKSRSFRQKSPRVVSTGSVPSPKFFRDATSFLNCTVEMSVVSCHLSSCQGAPSSRVVPKIVANT